MVFFQYKKVATLHVLMQYFYDQGTCLNCNIHKVTCTFLLVAVDTVFQSQ